MSDTCCTILIADDDKFIRDDLGELLAGSSHRLLFAATARETLECVLKDRPKLVLLDIKFPDNQDLTLLKRIRAAAPETEIIVISSQTEDISQIVESIKAGCFDYVGKPFVPEELRNRVEKALSLHSLRRSQERLVKELQERDGVDSLVGNSPPMSQVRDTIHKLADVDGCVLIRGESGTGKELAARALHYLSKRRVDPFVVVNCAAIPEALVESVLFGHRKGAFTGAVDSSKGRFEAAGEGTIFLDEIGDMPLPQQASLLRVLEYRRFTPVGENQERVCRARFVLATSRDLKESVREGKFREDLFFRINVASMSMPPLRTRVEDIPVIVGYYCRKLGAEMGRLPLRMQPEALDLLQQYDWPGNVRELRNTLEACIMLGSPGQDEITLRDLPPELLAARGGSGDSVTANLHDKHEKVELVRALQQSGGNQTQAARILGCHRNTIRSRIRYYGISDLTQDKP